MNDQRITDRDIAGAFAERAAGAPNIELPSRISAETARTRQSRPFLVLPGFASQATTRLAWAAALAALTIALVGVVAFGVGSRPFTGVVPSDAPSEEPTVSPSADPSVEPSPSVEPTPSSEPSVEPSGEPSIAPSGDPTPSPFVPPALASDRIGRVVATDGLRVRSLPTVAEESERLEPTLDEGTFFYVVDGPVLADGYAWYQVDPYRRDGGEPLPFGWVAAGSREAEPWIEDPNYGCDSISVSIGLLAETLAPQDNLYCYGVVTPGDIELTGQLVCDFGDVEGLASGPEWVQFDRFCSLQAPGFTIEDGVALRVWGTAVTSLLDEGSPVEGEYTVVGHFDDPGADECVSADPEQDPAETRLFCRMQFVATEVRPAQG